MLWHFLQLYIATKLPNPNFAPEFYAKSAVIDFTVTQQGLESQLLGYVVLKEKEQLEDQRNKLLQEINNFTKQKEQLEEALLATLGTSEGNLLDNSALIDLLATTKKTVLEVKEKLASNNETEKKINDAREEYRAVAKRGSVLYFLTSEMSLINNMYYTSLAQFLEIYDDAIKSSEKYVTSPPSQLYHILHAFKGPHSQPSVLPT